MTGAEREWMLTRTEESRREALEREREWNERSWLAVVEFWKHLVTIEATVLGLTVGLLGVTGRQSSGLLIAGWVSLLVAIALGCLLVRGAIAVESAKRFRTFRLNYDLTHISDMVDAGQLKQDSDEWRGLVMAAIATDQGWDLRADLASYQLAAKWLERLPSKVLLKTRLHPFALWMERKSQSIEVAFYVASFMSLVLMAGVVVVR